MLFRTPAAIKFMVGIDLLLAAVYLLNDGLQHGHNGVNRFFNLNHEGSLATWFSSMKWLLVAGLLCLFAWRNCSRTADRSWLLLLFPLVFVLLSLDEATQIHEWLGRQSDALLAQGDRSSSIFNVTGIWMFVIGLPFIGLFSALLYGVRRYFREAPAALVKLALGMAVMLTGALGVEMLSNFVVAGSTLSVMQVLLEELLEMLGATLVLWAAVDLLRHHGFRVMLQPVMPAAVQVPTARSSLNTP